MPAAWFCSIDPGERSAEFASFHPPRRTCTAARQTAAFVLFFLGFGIKAGVIPFHIWLPAAHPVAPSNMSALLSGIVIKTGIYGMTRIFLDSLGGVPSWAGWLVLIVGVVSAVLGVLYALMEHDLKRLLAYHSIENIGIILMGLGAALIFRVAGHPVLAADGSDRGDVSHSESCDLQVPSVPGSRVGASFDRNAQHGGNGRPDPSHAGNSFLFPDWRGRHLRPSPAERIRQ